MKIDHIFIGKKNNRRIIDQIKRYWIKKESNKGESEDYDFRITEVPKCF